MILAEKKIFKIDEKKLKYIFFVFSILLFAVLYFPQARLAYKSILLCNLIVLFSTAYFFTKEESVGTLLGDVIFVRSVFLQVLLQFVIFFYWGLYNQAVIDRIPLLMHQLIYAYFLNFCFCMYFKKKFSLTFSNSAAILSTNLFVWFDPSVYFIHLILAAAAILSKMFLTREINGEKKHIFNPSGFVSFFVMIGLSLAFFIPGFHLNEYAYAPQIGSYWLWMPHFDLVVFLASCLTLWTPNFYLIPIGAMTFLVGSNILSRFFMGMDFFETLGKGSIFLGITFLVTDPSTAPKSKLGQVLYGMTYAITLVVASPILSLLRWDQYYKKIMFVWLVNFLAPYFDSLAEWIEIQFKWLRYISVGLTRKKLLVIYFCFFAVVLNFVERMTTPPFLMDFTHEYNFKPRAMELVSDDSVFNRKRSQSSFLDRLIFSLSNGHTPDGGSGFNFAPFGETIFFSLNSTGRSFEDLYGRSFSPPPSPFSMNPNFEAETP